jgi:hypothetical protein
VGNLSKSKLKTVKNKYGLTQFENVSEILWDKARLFNEYKMGLLIWNEVFKNKFF